MAIAFACIYYGNSYAMVMLAMLLAGLGMGIMIPNANVWVMQLAPQEIRGREIGRLTTFWFMGQFLSPIILLPFLDSIKESKLFLVIAGILFGLSILTFGFYMISNKAKNI
jgi:MFS family permease